ncbi:MAG: PqqD family protein [Bacteroidales bacterium]|nr:PqqD family protein [Candidatus Cacconaster scatequi]
MKIREGFKMRKLGREHIVVAEGSSLVNFNKMISFNDTAAYLWEALSGKEFTVEDIKQLLLEKYEVDGEVAGADAARLARSWAEAGLIEE